MEDFKGLPLDHIAIAVNDLGQAKKTYQDLGFVFEEHTEEVPSQKVVAIFAKMGSDSSLEFLQPMGEQGPIYQFLKKNGPGLHHLCFSVEDIELKSRELQDKGYRLIYDSPVEGAHDCLVNFVHPKSAEGVLIELSQKRK